MKRSRYTEEQIAFYSLNEAQILTERWRREYNTIRPHGSLGYRPPAPETIMLKQAIGPT